MNRREFIKLTAGTVGYFMFSGLYPEKISANAKDGYHIVLVSDLHLPWRGTKFTDVTEGQKVFAQKEKLLANINSWKDVKESALLGDFPARYGNPDEFLSVDKFLKELKAPKYIIAGNHDCAYKDKPGPKNKLQRATHTEQVKKLNAFKERYNLPAIYYARTVGNYRLLYLSPDVCGNLNVELSKKQLNWMKNEVLSHSNAPIIFFCHAPLMGTLLNYHKNINTPKSVVEPENDIKEILRHAPKGSLWVSGHTHTPATNESYANDSINRYNENVVNIHNPTLDGKQLWTNSLYLYDNRAVVRTYDHTNGVWLENLTREYRYR